MDYDFPYIGNVIIPTDELIFFRGVGLNHQLVMDFTNDFTTNSDGFNHQTLRFHGD